MKQGGGCADKRPVTFRGAKIKFWEGGWVGGIASDVCGEGMGRNDGGGMATLMVVYRGGNQGRPPGWDELAVGKRGDFGLS